MAEEKKEKKDKSDKDVKKNEVLGYTIPDGTRFDKKNQTIAGPDGKVYGEFL